MRIRFESEGRKAMTVVPYDVAMHCIRSLSFPASSPHTLSSRANGMCLRGIPVAEGT